MKQSQQKCIIISDNNRHVGKILGAVRDCPMALIQAAVRGAVSRQEHLTAAADPIILFSAPSVPLTQSLLHPVAAMVTLPCLKCFTNLPVLSR